MAVRGTSGRTGSLSEEMSQKRECYKYSVVISVTFLLVGLRNKIIFQIRQIVDCRCEH
jgi:hypothetical protein